jgi:uncharacterized membrane protein YdbT with pleckstrin-like domain
MGYPKQLLANNERVLLQAKRHAIFMVLQVAPYVFGVIILGLLSLLSWQSVPTVGGWLGLLLLVGAIALLIYATYLFLEWKMEQYLVTNYRIIQIEGIMNRGTFDSALEMVNDVQMKQSIFGRMFNYANVNIITGSDVGINELHGISHPFEFKRALLEAKLAYSNSDRRMPMENSEFARFAAEQDRSSQPTGQIPNVENPSDPMRTVAALNELRNAGMISDAEFNEKMRQLTER